MAADRNNELEVSFSTFVVSLGTSALFHLGLAEDPDMGPGQMDLPVAKYNIDLLSMLATKTRGNLSPQEKELLDRLLYDLRLAYIRKTGG